MNVPTNGKLTNILQTIIIIFLGGFGVMFWATRSELKKDIGTVQTTINEMSVDQAVIRSVQEGVLKELEENKAEHKEIINLIR